MGWSSLAFLNKLPDERQTPKFFLESLPMGWNYTGGHPLASPVKLSSEPAEGYLDCIVPEGCSIRSAVLQPGDWTRTHGSLTVQTSLDATNGTHVDAVRNCVRGTFWALYVELAPYGRERVWAGVLRNVRWSMRGGFVLEFVELIGGLTTRNTRTGARAPLFSGLSTTTVAAGSPYTAADATLTVTDASGFEQASGRDHLIRVTPTSGNPFYLTATKSGNVFTVVARGIFDTLDANAAEGNLVEEIAYVARHPIVTAAEVLLSTGLATNGTYDVLPERWGLGIAEDLVDLQHMADVKGRLGSSTYAAYVRVDEAQADGLSWLAGFLQPFGLFLSMRQGSLTVGAVQLWFAPAAEIGDHDLSDLEWEAWDGDTPVEVGTWRSTYGTVTETASLTGDAAVSRTAEDTVHSRPVRDSDVLNLPDVFRSDLDLGTTADAQVTAWDTDVGGRLYPWATRPPERVRLRLPRWKHAELCIGDTIRLTSDVLAARAPNHPFSAGRLGLVVACNVDWFRGGMEIEALFYPESATEG